MMIVEEFGSLKEESVVIFVKPCQPYEFWILENWGKYFQERNIPYRIVEGRTGKDNRRVRWLEKEYIHYTVPELQEMGWRVEEKKLDDKKEQEAV